MLINVRGFKGILTKGGLTLGDPDKNDLAFVKDATDCILNKGDLCNGPVILDDYHGVDWRPSSEDTSKVVHEYLFKRLFDDPNTPEEVYKDYFQKYILVLLDHEFIGPNESNLKFMFLPNIFMSTAESIGQLPVGNNFANANIFNLLHKDTDTDRYKASSSNMISIGDWIFILGEFGIPNREPTPRILRFKMQYTDHINYHINPVLQFVGVKAPDNVTEYATSGVALTPSGTYDFAFTLVTASTKAYGNDYGYLFIDVHNALGGDDIESNAVRYGEGFTTQNTLKISLPAGYNGTEEITNYYSTYRLGIYIKKDNEVYYSFYDYIPFALEEIDGDWVILYTVPSTIPDIALRDSTRTAPFTDIIPITGAHDVPPPCRHGCYFKGRMYYASLKTPLNEIYYSQIAPDDDPNPAKYACYIEGKEPVGDANDPITGMIEYLGQMVIFKLNSIYVLTGDIVVDGEIRRLFSSLGCVNVLGGKAYIEVENILYFVASTGIYRFAGDQPIKISEFIQDEFDKIDKARLGFCRVSADKRYNLLYFSFPVGYKGSTDPISTWIYNYSEGGWTRQGSNNSTIQVLPATTANEAFGTYHSTPHMFADIGTIDDNPGDDSTIPNFIVKTGLFSLGKEDRFKQFKMFKLNMYPSKYIFFIAFDENLNTLSGQFNNKNEFYIGLNKKLLAMNLSPMSSGRFRITGYSLDAHITGRR